MGKKSKRPENIRSPKEKPTGNGNPITPALITTIGAVAVALITGLFAFPPFIAVFQKTPTVTPAATLVISPTFSTDTPFPLAAFPLGTDTPVLSSATLSATSIAVLPPTATADLSKPIGMNIRLSADKTSGKAPLTVKFDARSSFLRAPDGTIYPCKGGPCNYTWEVYKAGQKIGKPTENSIGTFQYTFGKRGAYFVTVYICRGHESSDCMGSGIPIEAK